MQSTKIGGTVSQNGASFRYAISNIIGRELLLSDKFRTVVKGRPPTRTKKSVDTQAPKLISNQLIQNLHCICLKFKRNW